MTTWPRVFFGASPCRAQRNLRPSFDCCRATGKSGAAVWLQREG
jgi:hypothetical protein